jgi:hypothetical protein
MQKRIDAKVKELVDEGYETAKRILTEKRDDLERLGQGLLEYETLTGSEIQKVIAGEPLNRGDDGDDALGLRWHPVDHRRAQDAQAQGGSRGRAGTRSDPGRIIQTKAPLRRGLFLS